MELKDLVHEIISISVIHRYHITKAALSVGLYFGQPNMLEYIMENSLCTQKELAEAMHITPASVAISLKRMEKAELITRTPDINDIRKNHICITEKGEKALQKFREICKATDENMFNGFSEDEQDILHGLLQRLHKNLNSQSLSKEEICEMLSKATPKGEDDHV
jgi:DNA-binding MarR family transcriptional regulator